MTAEELRAAAALLYGPGWRTSQLIADLPKANPRTVERWIAGKADIPPPAADTVLRLLSDRRQAIEAFLAA